MSIFEEIMDSDSSVFKNQEIFNINYFPEIIQCRDNELKSILINIKPLLTNNKALNTIIMGNTSTGKTTVIKHAMMEIEQYTDIKTCYLNCNIHGTARKCYFQIYKVLFGYPPADYISTEVLQEQIMEKLEEESFILVIDDMNHLPKADSNKLINELFRANEFYHVNIALIIVVTGMSFKYSLEKNARAVLQCNEVEFKDYTVDEIYNILVYRCELGFKNGVITKEQIRKISVIAHTYHDLRWALTMLNMLGQRLESENRDHVDDRDLSGFFIMN